MQIIKVIAQLYLIIGAGYLLQKKFKVDNKILTYFAVYIGLPALTFYGIYNGNYNKNLLILPLAYALVNIIALLCGYLFSRAAKYNFNDASIITTLSFAGNNGNFGIPVILFLLGDKALAMVSLMVLVNSIFLLGPGAYFMCRQKGAFKKSIIEVLKLPLLYGVIFGFILKFASIQIPNFILEACKATGYAMIPTQLILLGTFLAGVKFSHVDWKLITPSLILKMLVMPAIAYAVVRLLSLPLERDTYVMILEAATPFAVFSISLADLYNRRAKQVAMANFLSLLLVAITLPALWFLIH